MNTINVNVKFKGDYDEKTIKHLLWQVMDLSPTIDLVDGYEFVRAYTTDEDMKEVD